MSKWYRIGDNLVVFIGETFLNVEDGYYIVTEGYGFDKGEFRDYGGFTFRSTNEFSNIKVKDVHQNYILEAQRRGLITPDTPTTFVPDTMEGQNRFANPQTGELYSINGKWAKSNGWENTVGYRSKDKRYNHLIDFRLQRKIY